MYLSVCLSAAVSVLFEDARSSVRPSERCGAGAFGVRVWVFEPWRDEPQAFRDV